MRRYFRWDPELAAFSLFEWGFRGWSGLTSYDPRAGSRRKPSRTYLEKQRRGALIYRRGE
ncbi:PBECR2 nuclease fold domain-containing protein [Tateyamaria sp.]|uniref:PBECR2 nuclease fold domain-containing protein n=1 Tax=Tateyamaria sp. TaxID=1929288 RepID=UPI003B20E972